MALLGHSVLEAGNRYPRRYYRRNHVFLKVFFQLSSAEYYILSFYYYYILLKLTINKETIIAAMPVTAVSF